MVLAHYITRLILSYASKYIRNIEANVNWSLWSGDMQFNNLDLRLDVLQSSLGIPEAFQFSRGFIKNLRVQIPWSSLTTTPVEVTFTGIECVIDFCPPSNNDDKQTDPSSSPAATPRMRPESTSTRKRGDSTNQQSSSSLNDADSEASGGWASDLISRIIANISIHVNDFTLRYRERDITASIHLKRFSLHSTDPSWRSTAFTDLLGPWKLIHKAVVIENIACFLYQHNPDLNHHRDKSSSSDSHDDVEHQHIDDRGSQAACILSDLSLSVRIKSYLAALGAAIDVSAWAPSQSQSYSSSILSSSPAISANGQGVALVPRPLPPPCGSAITIDVHVTRSVHASLSCFQFERLYQLIQSQTNFYATSAAAARVAQSIAAVPARIDSAPTPIQPVNHKHRSERHASSEPSRQRTLSQSAAGHPGPRGWTSWMWDAVAEDDETDVDHMGDILIDQRAVFERDFGHLQPTNDLAFCLHIPSVELTLCDTNDNDDEALNQPSHGTSHDITQPDGSSTVSAKSSDVSSKIPFAALHISEVGMSLLQPLILTTNITRKQSRRMSEDANNSQADDKARPPTFAFNVVSVSVAVIDDPNVKPRPIVRFGPDIPHHYLPEQPSTPIRRQSSSLSLMHSPSHSSKPQSCAHSPCLHRSHYWDMVTIAKAQSIIHAFSLNHVVNRIPASVQPFAAARYEPCIELTLAPLATTVDFGEPNTRRVFETLSIFWRPAAKERAETRSREQRWIEEKALLVSSLRTTIDELGSQQTALQDRIRELEEQLQAKSEADIASFDASEDVQDEQLLDPPIVRSRQHSAASPALSGVDFPIRTPTHGLVKHVVDVADVPIENESHVSPSSHPRSSGMVRSMWSWLTLSSPPTPEQAVVTQATALPRPALKPLPDDVEILY